MTNTDLPDGYRWAREDEMDREDAIVVKRTTSSNGHSYTQDEADIAVPMSESELIEQSEQRQSDFFYRRSKNNTKNPFED